MEGPTDRYIQFIGKLDKRHCRLLIELPIGYINLAYILPKMRKSKTPYICRRCSAEKEMLVHILYEYPALETISICDMVYGKGVYVSKN